MRDATPAQDQTIHLKDYAPVPVTVTHVDLHFRLDPRATEVSARLTCARRGPGDMVLNGEHLELVSLAMDGAPLAEARYTLTDTTLTLHDAPDRFLLETVARISPETNTALEGLYMSNGMYCTQCEAEGFRRITWMLDRPDVMATYDVEIEADLPVLLSNGDEVARGKWHDPWPKPTYLFALVAGNLVASSDRFTTMEGRDVALNVWVRPGDEGRTGYALDALKRSMAWDETEYGRGYDLSVFNIVAVDDFNMGAMENKGLNVFNSKFVLASPETATDTDYASIEAIVAHEYFHNWTGNRVTCRDWFQLCLKEGLTVFRDQQFSADMRSEAVERIGEVLQLRARQFREDAGPLAHPVRPESFVEINNFYTATVYEKGAEVIRMLHTLVGPEAYRAGCDLYFERHDGAAVTIEDWLACFEEATRRDLSQFALWYRQAGTPRVSVEEIHADGVFRAILRQEVPDTPGQSDKAPMVVPVAWGLLDRQGNEMRATEVFELTGAEAVIEVACDVRPVPSWLRGFSAPVVLEQSREDADLLTLMASDTDPYVRWESGRALAKDRLVGMIVDGKEPDWRWLRAASELARDDRADPAFRALALALPSEDDLAQTLHGMGVVPDPDAIHAGREAAGYAMAAELQPHLVELRTAMRVTGPYDPNAEDAGKRSFDAVLLRMTTRLDGGEAARAAYRMADNMTDRMAAFACLLEAGDAEVAKSFEDDWAHDRMVMDKWFSAQVMHAAPDRAVGIATGLTRRDDFDMANPNRFRSVVGALAAGNPAGFHRADGSGYRFLADWLLKMDALNPQTAARLSTAFDTWRRYDADRQDLVRAQLERIAGAGISRDLSEMVGRMLGG